MYILWASAACVAVVCPVITIINIVIVIVIVIVKVKVIVIVIVIICGLARLGVGALSLGARHSSRFGVFDTVSFQNFMFVFAA